MHANFRSNEVTLGQTLTMSSQDRMNEIECYFRIFIFTLHQHSYYYNSHWTAGRSQTTKSEENYFVLIFGVQQRLCHLIFLILTRLCHQTTLYIQCFSSFFFLSTNETTYFSFAMQCDIRTLTAPSIHYCCARWMRPTSVRSCHARHFAPVLKFHGAESCASNDIDWT